jgi:hypothetical protein
VLKNAPYVDNSCKWAGGGFVSNVLDLVRFGNAMLFSYQNKGERKAAAQELKKKTDKKVELSSAKEKETPERREVSPPTLQTPKNVDYCVEDDESNEWCSDVELSQNVVFVPGPFHPVNQREEEQDQKKTEKSGSRGGGGSKRRTLPGYLEWYPK